MDQNNMAIEADKKILPEDIKNKFNWGAFFLNWIWGSFHKYYWPIIIIFATSFVAQIVGVIVATVLKSVFNFSIFTTVITTIPFVVVISLIYQIWLGKKGNQIAWERKEWRDVEHFKVVQKKWAITGIILAVVAGLVFFLVSLMLFIGLKNTYEEIDSTLTDTTTEQYPLGIITGTEIEWLKAEYAKFREVIETESDTLVINYLVDAPGSLYNMPGEFLDSENEYRSYYERSLLSNGPGFAKEWNQMMPTSNEFNSLLNQSFFEKYDDYFNEGIHLASVELPTLQGRDYGWFYDFIIFPEEERVFFLIQD